MLGRMQAIIATFERPEQAQVYERLVRQRLNLEVSTARLGAAGEPFDGHQLVVAWVSEEQAGLTRTLVMEAGGVLHDAAFGANPMRDAS